MYGGLLIAGAEIPFALNPGKQLSELIYGPSESQRAKDQPSTWGDTGEHPVVDPEKLPSRPRVSCSASLGSLSIILTPGSGRQLQGHCIRLSRALKRVNSSCLWSGSWLETNLEHWPRQQRTASGLGVRAQEVLESERKLACSKPRDENVWQRQLRFEQESVVRRASELPGAVHTDSASPSP